MEAAGLSLWLTPTGPASEHLVELIGRLSARFRTPVFAPHLTLLGGLTQPQTDVVAQTRRLGAGLDPFLIRLVATAHGHEFFRSIFLVAELSAELGQAHGLARSIFAVEDRPFFPHVSLLYGRLSEDVRECALAVVGAEFPRQFEARAVDVVSTEGPVEAWRLLAKVPLAGHEGGEA